MYQVIIYPLSTSLHTLTLRKKKNGEKFRNSPASLRAFKFHIFLEMLRTFQ